MKHNLKISVSKSPQIGGLVTCRRVNVRERFLRFLFGYDDRNKSKIRKDYFILRPNIKKHAIILQVEEVKEFGGNEHV